MPTKFILYSIREGHNGLWSVLNDDLVVSAGLRLGPAIKLARLLALEKCSSPDIGCRVEMLSCGHRIDLGEYTQASVGNDT
jgi:hypothetical protein